MCSGAIPSCHYRSHLREFNFLLLRSILPIDGKGRLRNEIHSECSVYLLGGEREAGVF